MSSSSRDQPQSSTLTHPLFFDLLPSLEELAAREETVKVTITLSKLSVEYFKEQARLHQTQYQRMIRRLLDEYVQLCTEFGQSG